jgi:hypothetical protein
VQASPRGIETDQNPAANAVGVGLHGIEAPQLLQTLAILVSDVAQLLPPRRDRRSRLRNPEVWGRDQEI